MKKRVVMMAALMLTAGGMAFAQQPESTEPEKQEVAAPAPESATEESTTQEEKAEKAIELLDKFYTDVMKVPSRISQYGCSQDKAWIDDCVAKLAKSGAKFGENADILPEDVKTIILQSY